MDAATLYRQADSGDPYALAAIRSLTSRVTSGRASPRERAAHAELVRLHAGGAADDVDDRTFAQLSSLMSQIAGRPLMQQHPQIGRGGGGGHGGGGHGGGLHGGGRFSRGGGGGWGWGWGWGWPGYGGACYWDPVHQGWACWTPYGWALL